MRNVAVAIVCKTPLPGYSKTRLSPPLDPEDCAALSACFIEDLSRTVNSLCRDGDVTGYALYTPVGSAPQLRKLLPEIFQVLPQRDGDFGERLMAGAADLLSEHDGAILVNSDSPTLPREILRAAVDALANDEIVLGPAHDGGYTLIGLTKLYSHLFHDIPWSTAAVFELTLKRAAEIGVRVAHVPGWYDIDDADSLKLLEDEISGKALPFTALPGSHAPATRRFLEARHGRI